MFTQYLTVSPIVWRISLADAIKLDKFSEHKYHQAREQESKFSPRSKIFLFCFL